MSSSKAVFYISSFLTISWIKIQLSENFSSSELIERIMVSRQSIFILYLDLVQ